MTTAKRKKPQPVYVYYRRLADPRTGETVDAMVPASQTDRKILEERRTKFGDRLRGMFTKQRNPKFHRLVHQLGTAVKENVEGFEDCATAHDVIKRLQRESGLFCEQQEIDANPIVAAVIEAARTVLGDAAARMLQAVLPSIKKVNVSVAQSIAFDEMDEGDFQLLWRGLCDFIARTYWPGLDVAAIENMITLMPEAA